MMIAHLMRHSIGFRRIDSFVCGWLVSQVMKMMIGDDDRDDDARSGFAVVSARVFSMPYVRTNECVCVCSNMNINVCFWITSMGFPCENIGELRM